MLGSTKDLPIHFLDMDFSIEDEEMVNRVVGEIKQRKITLVIVDSLIRVHSQDENTSTGMAKVFKQLRKIQDAGAAVLFTHHHRKKIGFVRASAVDDLRGSTDILAAVDSHLAVVTQPEGTIKVAQPKLRQEQAISGFTLQFTNGGFAYLGEVEEEKAKVDLAKADIIELLEEGSLMRKDIVEQLVQLDNYGESTISDAMKELLEKKTINYKPGDKPHSKIYFLTEDTTDDGTLFANTYIEQSIKVPATDSGSEQTIEQRTIKKIGSNNSTLEQSTNQTTDGLTKFKEELKSEDTEKLSVRRDNAEDYITRNPHHPKIKFYEQSLQLIEEELTKRLDETEAVDTFTKGVV